MARWIGIGKSAVYVQTADEVKRNDDRIKALGAENAALRAENFVLHTKAGEPRTGGWLRRLWASLRVCTTVERSDDFSPH